MASGSDVAEAELVVAVLERRLAEAEARIRAAEAEAQIFADTIRALKPGVANADAVARDRTVAGTPINPDLAHLHRDGRSGSDVAEVELVVAVLERKLAEAEAWLRVAQAEARIFADSIRALKPRVANAEALARDRTVAGEDDQSQAGDHLTARDDVGAAELTGGEIRARVVPEIGAGEITPGLEAAGAEAGDEYNIPSPVPLMLIEASPVPVTAAPALPDELIDERAVEEDVAMPRSHDYEVEEAGEKASEAIAGKRKNPACDLSIQLDNLRVTSHKVSDNEAAHGDDVAASHQAAQGEEQPAKATKKTRRQKVPSFYNQVFIALKEQENLLKKKEAEAIAKKAAAAAAKQLHCTCYCSAL